MARYAIWKSDEAQTFVILWVRLPPVSSGNYSSLGMKTVVNTSEFEQMLAAERALVFIQARWSSYAMRTRGIINVFEQRVNSHALRFDYEFEFWEIDLSDQEGDLWDATRAWLLPQSDHLELLMWSGGGSILWCSRGTVLKSSIRVEQLINVIEVTREAFI